MKKFVLFLLGGLMAFSVMAQERDEDPIYQIVEDMPEFPGDEAFPNYLANSVSYPVDAKKNGIEGKVFVSFVVEKDGSVGNVKIERGVDPSLDKEALRAVSELPQWKPGSQRGEAVRVMFTVPINFALFGESMEEKKTQLE